LQDSLLARVLVGAHPSDNSCRSLNNASAAQLSGSLMDLSTRHHPTWHEHHLEQPHLFASLTMWMPRLQEDGQTVVGTVSHVCSRGLRLKVGIDVGKVMDSVHAATGRMAYRGKVMNRAARIASAASSGQVLWGEWCRSCQRSIPWRTHSGPRQLQAAQTCCLSNLRAGHQQCTERCRGCNSPAVLASSTTRVPCSEASMSRDAFGHVGIGVLAWAECCDSACILQHRMHVGLTGTCSP
jgi:hypothetical protein